MSLCSLLFACFLVFGFTLRSVVTYAAVSDLLIVSASNATASDAGIMTLDLTDVDYSVMPISSLGTVSNTISASYITIHINLSDGHGNTKTTSILADYSDGRFNYSYAAPSGWYISEFVPIVYKPNLPNVGYYELSYDFSSDISYGIRNNIYWYRAYNNASSKAGRINLNFDSASGDLYAHPQPFHLNTVTYLGFTIDIVESNISLIAGSFAIRFTPIEPVSDAPSTGLDTNSQDYQSDVSSSLSDLSSSVGEMTEEISGVTEAIQNLQGAMEPHYNNVLTQLHHITEQLHAFWDQQFNLHHVPLMAKLEDIKTAIANMDLEVVVELDELKQTVNNMSQAIQNKLQSVQDGINNKLQSVQDTLTGGYNSGGIDSENDELASALDDLDQSEQEVIGEVSGYLEDFEYPSFESAPVGILSAIGFFGSFLQAIFLNMGDFGLIITFSLTMIFALIIVGYHRIRT